jgi:hypothetical protein
MGFDLSKEIQKKLPEIDKTIKEIHARILAV